jgi:hypothetical protein
VASCVATRLVPLGPAWGTLCNAVYAVWTKNEACYGQNEAPTQNQRLKSKPHGPPGSGFGTASLSSRWRWGGMSVGGLRHGCSRVGFVVDCSRWTALIGLPVVPGVPKPSVPDGLDIMFIRVEVGACLV